MALICKSPYLLKTTSGPICNQPLSVKMPEISSFSYTFFGIQD